MQSFGDMQTMATTIFSTYASIAASLMLFRTIANDMVPAPVKSFFYSRFCCFLKLVMDNFFNTMSNRKMTAVVDEQNGFTRNQIYDAAEVYLRSKICPDAERLKVNKSPKQKSITLSMVKGQEIVDLYKDRLEVKWQYFLVENNGGDHGRFQAADKRYFEVTFLKKDRDVVLNEYLPFILAKAEEVKEIERPIKLYTRDCPFDDTEDNGGNGGGGRGGGGYWGCVNLDHPLTFEKLAMDKKLKRAIMEDLDRFVRRKDYYRKVGKAWKRGYLLYGPPGTGKSSLIAAMANYLRFDVYDLELNSVYSDSELRRVLLSTKNKSIIVLEDIDCSSQVHDRHGMEYGQFTNDTTKLTLSGLLNFVDGLWSSCGDERIIIFTTNHKEKLDPALLRPGRMDMHIHMGYCSPEGFDALALTYLGLHEHEREHHACLAEIKELIGRVEITPAEVAEHLMRNEDVKLVLEGVLDLLKEKQAQE